MGLQLDYNEDDVIMTENTPGRYMYLILDGSVALYSNYKTPEEYLYGILGKGKTFGEMGLLTHEESIYTVVALSKLKVAVFSENELGSFIKGYPEHALGVMRSIAKMNQLFRINLKMVIDENKDNLRYRSLYEDVIKESAEITDVDEDAIWHSTIQQRKD